MPRNIQKERVAIYLANPKYFKDKLYNNSSRNKVKKRNLDIAFSYLDNEKTLYEVGKEFHITRERVRQIVAKILFRIFNLNLNKTKEIEIMQNFTELKTREGYKRFQQYPNYYKKVLNEKMNMIRVQIVLLLFEQGLGVAEIGKRTGRATGGLYALVARAMKIIEEAPIPDEEAQEVPSPTVEEQVKESSNRLRPLDQGDFDMIKDMLYRGEPQVDIANAVGRSHMVVYRVAHVNTLQEYFEVERLKQRERAQMRKNLATLPAEVAELHAPKPPIVPPPVPEDPSSRKPDADNAISKFGKDLTKLIEEYDLVSIMANIKKFRDKNPDYEVIFEVRLKTDTML